MARKKRCACRTKRRRMFKAIGAFLLLGVSFSARGVSGQSSETTGDNPVYHTPRGPIAIRDMRPYNLLFLQFLPESGDTLRSGGTRFRLQLDVANNMLIPSPKQGATVVEDNEYQRVTFSWQHGLGRQTEIGVFLPLEWRNGGFTDGLIQAYHHLIGYAANQDDIPSGRDHYPNYRSKLQIGDAIGHLFVDQGNAFGFGETTITLKRGLIPVNRRSALALRLGVKLPTGNPNLLLGSGNLDAGLSLDARYSVGRDIILYGNAAGALLGHAYHLPGAQPSMAQGFGGLEYRPNNRDSFFLQIDSNSLSVRTGNHFADMVATAGTFGYKRVLDRHNVFIASFSENGGITNYSAPFIANIGPNIFTAGLEWYP